MGLLLAEFGRVPLGTRLVFRSGVGMPEPACWYFGDDGLRGTWPGRESGAQRSDVLLTEPVAKELLVGNAVELGPCISEVSCGQAGIEAASEVNELGRAVAVQHPSHIGVVAWFDPARQRTDLPAYDVFQRQGRADLHDDWRLAPAAIDRAIGGRGAEPILLNTRGTRMDPARRHPPSARLAHASGVSIAH